MGERETDYDQFSKRIESDTRPVMERSAQFLQKPRVPSNGSVELSQWVELIQRYRKGLENLGVEFRGRNAAVGMLVHKGVGATGVVEIVESVSRSRK